MRQIQTQSSGRLAIDSRDVALSQRARLYLLSQTVGDYNPIHINPYFSDFAPLPGTITHGMWSIAATHKYVETVIAQGKPERVIT